MTQELPTVTKEFIVGNQKLCQTMSKSRRGGPYTKSEKTVRRDEVYRLHFEFGYSARKIADLMKINKNTINGDIDYWYSKIKQTTNILNPADKIIATLERFKVQRTRLRELIEKVSDTSEKIAIERLLFDIDSKICFTYQRVTESEYRMHSKAVQWANKLLEKLNRPERIATHCDTVKVSIKAREKISRIIKEDQGKKY